MEPRHPQGEAGEVHLHQEEAVVEEVQSLQEPEEAAGVVEGLRLMGEEAEAEARVVLRLLEEEEGAVVGHSLKEVEVEAEGARHWRREGEELAAKQQGLAEAGEVGQDCGPVEEAEDLPQRSAQEQLWEEAAVGWQGFAEEEEAALEVPNCGWAVLAGRIPSAPPGKEEEPRNGGHHHPP